MVQADSQSTTILPTNVIAFRPRTKPPQSALAAFRQQQEAKTDAKLAELHDFPERLSKTCQNSRLRLARRKQWYKARRTTDFWRACLDWTSALSIAQMHGIDQAVGFSPSTADERYKLLVQWRVVLVEQMLTPAPSAEALAWKRTALRRGQYKHVGVATEALQKAIDDDARWLADHPVRKPKREA